MEIALQHAIIDLVEYCEAYDLLPSEKHGMEGQDRVRFWRRLMAKVDQEEQKTPDEAQGMREKLSSFLATEIRVIEDHDESIRQKIHGGTEVGYRALKAQVSRLQRRQRLLLAADPASQGSEE